MTESENLSPLFLEASRLAADGFYAEAAAKYVQGAEAKDPEWSDDCLVNAGICYLQIGLLDEAIDMFRREIEDYPGSALSNAVQGNEFGETSAKSHYGILQGQAAQGKLEEARKELEALKEFDGRSWVVGPEGKKRSYHELGEHFLESLAAADTPEVSGEDVTSDG